MRYIIVAAHYGGARMRGEAARRSTAERPVGKCPPAESTTEMEEKMNDPYSEQFGWSAGSPDAAQKTEESARWARR